MMTQQKPKAICLSPTDNVAVALMDLSPDDLIGKRNIRCREQISVGHKIAISKINASDPIWKYKHVIGFASKPILPGEHVHTHNMEPVQSIRDFSICKDPSEMPVSPKVEQATFNGIIRADGMVATRNYVGVLATVNCAGSVARFIAKSFSDMVMVDFPNVDGVVSLVPESGCGMVRDGEDLHLLQRTIAGYKRHPNFAGALLVGLGCEVNQIKSLVNAMGLETGNLFRTLEIQKAGGAKKALKHGVEIVREILHDANRVKRSLVPASNIVLGLKCSGSDVYSGISANPALGVAVDLLLRQGGTAILSETPEFYGSENLLKSRALNPKVAEKMSSRFLWWDKYVRRYGRQMNNSLTQEDVEGGLTTIVEKSLVAASKGGTSNLVGAYEYAETIFGNGLVFMDTPAHDVVSITGMVASGANIVGFTTGLGTLCGSKPAPVIKLASNTKVYRQLMNDLDVNCGSILDGDNTVLEMGESIFSLILEIASGKKTKGESMGYEGSDFMPWQFGPVL